MPIQNFESTWMTDEHKMLLESATRFFKEQWGPKDEAWRAQGMMDRQAGRDAVPTASGAPPCPRNTAAPVGDFGHEAALILAQAAVGRVRLRGFAALGHRRALHPACTAPKSRKSAGCPRWPRAS